MFKDQLETKYQALHRLCPPTATATATATPNPGTISHMRI
jgi:hypothetical protein